MTRRSAVETASHGPVAWAAECPGPTAESRPIMLFGYTSQLVNHLALARGEVVHPFPLYRTPQPTLTDAEREAIRSAVCCLEDDYNRLTRHGQKVMRTLRSLLARLA